MEGSIFKFRRLNDEERKSAKTAGVIMGGIAGILEGASGAEKLLDYITPESLQHLTIIENVRNGIHQLAQIEDYNTTMEILAGIAMITVGAAVGKILGVPMHTIGRTAAVGMVKVLEPLVRESSPSADSPSVDENPEITEKASSDT